MSKRLTTKEFIDKARAVHGDRYDYSTVNYVSAKKKVIVVCPEHGEFLQQPSNHLMGNGCPTCGGRAPVSTESFIAKARNIHGERYDYSRVDYVAAIKAVIIICPEHGEFSQRPANHLSGKGCRKCGGNAPLAHAEFIARATALHGDRYDYSGVKFSNVEDKIIIKCHEHGVWHQRLFSHLKGFGCPKCGRENVAKKLGHDKERFEIEAQQAHGEKYDYSKVQYINALTNVLIVCPKHGEFAQKPASHVRGVGCPKCGDESAAALRVRSTEDFIVEAKAVHGSKYDYSKCAYKTSSEKVEIYCFEHGSFWPMAHNHLRGSGCPDCAESGFNPSMPGLLYYIAIATDDEQTLYKIGITNLSVEKRFPTADRARLRIVKLWHFDLGRKAADLEREILTEFEPFKYRGPKVLVGAGNEELFTKDVLKLDKDNEADLAADLPIFRRRQMSLDL